ncbi:MAG: dihydrolipoyl dehydrogenase [Pseudomonadota bacterium]
MSQKIVIIGAGPGGYVAALRAAALGADVTLVEKEHVGGTCLNWGCIPSKIMKTTADLVLKFKDAESYGITCPGSPVTDMSRLMLRKKRIIETQRQGIHALLKKSSVRFMSGRGYVKGSSMASVVSDTGNETDVPFDKLILATGTEPLNLPAFPFDGRVILSSNHLLSLDTLPRSMVIVGGGVIGCEFAFILNAFGTTVTVVEAMDRLLPLDSVDDACSKVLLREMKKSKITCITNRAVTRTEKHGDRLKVFVGGSPFDNQRDLVKEQVLDVETMAVCIGRSPLSRSLGLENLGLETDPRGWIPVNASMETSVPGVYAIGDILGPQRVMLAHVASHEGMVAAQNAMGMATIMHYDAIPGAVFTMPEIGDVGLTEKQALAKGIDAQCTTVQFRALGKAQAMGEIAGEGKVVSHRETGKILGVHLIGPHATDLIAEGALAVRNGLSLWQVAETIHAHPTLAEIMGEISFKGTGRAIHG